VFFVTPQQVSEHYYHFIHSTGGYAPRRSFLHLIWLCVIWVLWNERNQRLFTNTAQTAVHLLEKVKLTSLRWMKAKNVSFPFGYHMWWQHPLVCLGIGWCIYFICWQCFQNFCCNFVLIPKALLVLGNKTSYLYISFWLVEKKNSVKNLI